MDKIDKLIEEIREAMYIAFTQSELRTSTIIISMLITIVLSVYIFFIYRIANKTGFYSKNFNKTVAIMGIVTGGIVLSMQTSVFISLGMVGALSIVRFRNVVKDPFDLLFLFWSISTGIICGTGLYKVAFLLALVVTAAIFLLEFVTLPKAPALLVVNSTNKGVENALMAVVQKYSKYYRVKSRNLTANSLDMIIEVRPAKEQELLAECAALDGATSVALLAHDGELRG